MAFTATEKTQIYQIMGITEDGIVTIPHQLVGLWGPYQESYSMTAVVTALEARLTVIGANATAYAMCQGILTAYYTTIGDSSQTRITSDGGTSGVIADDKAELEYLRRKLCNILGFYCPKGGFMAEIDSRFGSSGGRVVRG